MTGQIVRVIAGFYDVVASDKEYRIRGSGKLRNSGKVPLVGDFVDFEPNKLLEKILQRNNSLLRPKVANIDQAVIVQSLMEPKYSSFLLNKFLAIIESENIKPIIIFTKTDLTDFSPLSEYIKDGYEAYEISNNNLESLSQLKYIFKNKLTVFTGQTGAGKSTTINNLTGSTQETQVISKALGRGKHTTRVVEIVPWLGGRLIDTPGFSSLDISHLTRLEISKSYHDFETRSKHCKFDKNCIHDKELSCAIKEDVALGKISKVRYEDYIKLLGEVK